LPANIKNKWVIFLLLFFSFNLSFFSLVFAQELSNEDTFNVPYGLAINEKGNLVIVDSHNNSIKKVAGDDIKIISGFTQEFKKYGFAQNGYMDGPAWQVRFNRPRGIVVNSRGDIFITDTLNHVVRKIADGRVTTFAGTGKAGYADGVAPKAQFNLPSGLTVDQEDNLYVADTLNHVIRKITPNGVVSTFAGRANSKGGFQNGGLQEALFNEPEDLCFNNQGDLYIVDSGNQLLRKISKGQVSTFAGSFQGLIPGTSYRQGGFKNGRANTARFNFPKGIDIAENGVVFIADTYNHRIRAITLSEEVITVVGTGEPGGGETTLNGPVDVLYHNGKLYISDMWNNRVQVVPINLNSLLRAVTTSVSNLQVYLNEEKIAFSARKPYITNGKTMVPLQEICAKLGIKINWLKSEGKLELTKGSRHQVLNFAEQPDERTMIHIRVLAEKMGFKIKWLPEYNRVIIS